MGYRSNELLPAREVKGTIASDRLKVRRIAGNYGSTNAAGRQGDQDIKGQLSNLVSVEVVTTPHLAQEFCCFNPLLPGGSHNLAVFEEVSYEAFFYSRPGTPKQLVQHDRRASGNKS